MIPITFIKRPDDQKVAVGRERAADSFEQFKNDCNSYWPMVEENVDVENLEQTQPELFLAICASYTRTTNQQPDISTQAFKKIMEIAMTQVPPSSRLVQSLQLLLAFNAPENHRLAIRLLQAMTEQRVPDAQAQTSTEIGRCRALTLYLTA